MASSKCLLNVWKKKLNNNIMNCAFKCPLQKLPSKVAFLARCFKRKSTSINRLTGLEHAGPGEAGGEGASGGREGRARHGDDGEGPGGSEEARRGDQSAPANRRQRPFLTGEAENVGGYKGKRRDRKWTEGEKSEAN